MRICMLAYTFYENDNRVIRYAETLNSLGHNVDIIALRNKDDDKYKESNGIKIFKIQNRIVNEKHFISYIFKLFTFFVKSNLFLISQLFKYKYDIIHVHNPPDFLIFSCWIQKLLGSKLVLDFHDVLPEFYQNKFNASENSILYKIICLVEKLSISISDHVIVSNHIWGEKLANRSIRNKKSTVILNYPDLNLFSEIHKDSIQRNNNFVIIYPGTLLKHQGVDIAIRAMNILKEEINNIKFLIYGEGTYKAELIQFTNNLGINDIVFFMNKVQITEIPKIMAHADVGLVPKRNDSFGGEAFSTKVFEFMALGVPIVISKTKIDSFYFNDSLVRFFIPEDEEDLANAIKDLYHNSEKRKLLVKNSLKYISENNWQKKSYLYVDLINSLH